MNISKYIDMAKHGEKMKGQEPLPYMKGRKPTIQELEAILESADCPIEILPNGEVRAVEGRSPIKHKVNVNPISILEEKGREPLSYTADEIMDIVTQICENKILGEVDAGVKSVGVHMFNQLQAIAERYEYMNMHFNPAKSILPDDDYSNDPPTLIAGEGTEERPWTKTYCDPEKGGI